ncbi:MAG: beta-ketoacyl-[acyl-carrier-protein] synthase [Gammaproteobacteria bacterium]|nr:beta-ketoacyl-[acyl-carrier-protein] synthase [Gammaproteobacteria bacterium]
MNKRRVVVTGLGMISPLGLDVASSWEGIIAGKSGIRMITEFDTTEFAVKFAGTIEGFDPTQYIPVKDVKKMDISLQYGVAAACEAWSDAGITVTEENARRIGVSIGSGIGGLTTIQETAIEMSKEGPKRISPFFIPSAIINMISGQVAIRFGLKGPNIAIVTACTTGTHNIGYAARTIAYGDADVMVAGGAEKASCELGIGGFAAARALSRRNDAPEKASRPWDKDRDGFVLGDGAGVVVLEEYEHAKRRGAKIYAEIIGFGMSEDAFHMTMPDGVGSYYSMVNAVEDAGIMPSEIDYINAHGTSTPAGDVVESQTVEKFLGDHAKNVSMSSTKSMIGHALGAAGALEAIFCILAIRDQIAPPTINLENPAEGCNLDYVPNVAKKRKIDVALSNSFGFGGTNGTVIFKKL